ncbi:DUF2782 domain-containing protein [Janthinobacterium sp. 17J80-10]|uniref:DUF2782 domain-containing protein n=1 Tax=Janthinobacterium sp. 17J80-10 TaxID=2497863 RepID=UPI0010052D98|nr:DUF2782 domain-containing protein [Janthinobacterium sp. 17J80-10]QAU35736.1 DUF2782 domain-containing protein [Janthinobacterium sp. 17J80-10]
MRQIRSHLLVGLWLTAAASLPALAQQRADAPPPPRMEKLEEGAAPAVTITPPSEKSTVTEKRAPGGKRTEVKVKTGKSTYRVQPADEPGNAQRGDGQSIAAKPAQVEVMQFDMSGKRKLQKEPVEPTPTLQPAPEKK